MRLVELTYVKDTRAENAEHRFGVVHINPEHVTHLMACDLREYPAGSTTVVIVSGARLIVVHPTSEVVQRLARTWGK